MPRYQLQVVSYNYENEIGVGSLGRDHTRRALESLHINQIGDYSTRREQAPPIYNSQALNPVISPHEKPWAVDNNRNLLRRSRIEAFLPTPDLSKYI